MRGRQPPGDKILRSTETACHFSHLLQVSKQNLFEVWFYTHFFHDFIHVYSPGAGAGNPLGTKFWCQQEHLVSSVICYNFQNYLFEDWFYTFFLDLIYVYSPRAGADSPQGTTFYGQQKRHVTSFICCKIKINLFKVWFYINFLMI